MRTATVVAIMRRTFLRSFAPSKSNQLTTQPMMSSLQRTLRPHGEATPTERPNTYRLRYDVTHHDRRTPPSRITFLAFFLLYVSKLFISFLSNCFFSHIF